MLNVNSPYDNHLIKNLALTEEGEIEDIIQSAHELFLDKNNWLTPSNRISILDNIYKIMQIKKLDLALLASEEGGKPLKDSKIEIDRAMQGVLIAKNNIANLTGVEIPMQLNNASLYKRSYTQKSPLGVVYAISAFNHPINLIIHQVITAIATGCPVIIKPASTTQSPYYAFVRETVCFCSTQTL